MITQFQDGSSCFCFDRNTAVYLEGHAVPRFTVMSGGALFRMRLGEGKPVYMHFNGRNLPHHKYTSVVRGEETLWWEVRLVAVHSEKAHKDIALHYGSVGDVTSTQDLVLAPDLAVGLAAPQKEAAPAPEPVKVRCQGIAQSTGKQCKVVAPVGQLYCHSHA